MNQVRICLYFCLKANKILLIFIPYYTNFMDARIDGDMVGLTNARSGIVGKKVSLVTVG